jgi:hypothetical protein
MRETKNLTPLQIDFLYFYIDNLYSKSFATKELIVYIKQILYDGYYLTQDTAALNKMVEAYKLQWKCRKTGPVQYKTK